MYAKNVTCLIHFRIEKNAILVHLNYRPYTYTGLFFSEWSFILYFNNDYFRDSKLQISVHLTNRNMDTRSNLVCIGVVYKRQGYIFTVGYNVGEGKKLSLVPKSPKDLKKQAHSSCLLKWEVGLRFVWTWLKDTAKLFKQTQCNNVLKWSILMLYLLYSMLLIKINSL